MLHIGPLKTYFAYNLVKILEFKLRLAEQS